MTLINKFKKLFEPIDLTKGSIYKTIIVFTIPILLSLLFQQIYSISDAIIIGQNLNHSEISGINDAYAITFMFTEFFIGLASGFSVLIAKKVGANDRIGARQSLLIQMLLGLIIGIIFSIIFAYLVNPLLGALDISYENDSDKYNSAYYYTLIIASGSITMLFYNIAVGALRSVGETLMPFLFLVFSTILNICLDLLFIIVLKWGVVGAAVATIASQFIASVLAFVYLFVRYHEFRFQKEDFKFSFSYILEHLKLGLPLAFQFSILGIGIIVMQAGIIAFDINPTISTYPAENGIGAAYKLSNFLMCPLMALGTSMLSFMGQNLGAKNHQRIKDGFKASMIIGTIAFAIVFVIGLLLTINGAFLYIFLNKEKITNETIKFGNDYMYVMLPFELSLMALFVMRNSLQGVEKSLYPFLAGVAELVARCLVCYFLPALINGGAITSTASEASYIALCFADPVAWLLADAVMIYPIIKHIYKNKNLTVK